MNDLPIVPMMPFGGITQKKVVANLEVILYPKVNNSDSFFETAEKTDINATPEKIPAFKSFI